MEWHMKWLECLTRIIFLFVSGVCVVSLYWLAVFHGYLQLIFLVITCYFLVFGGYVTTRSLLWWWQYGESGRPWRELPWFVKVSGNLGSPRDWFWRRPQGRS
jgi:hypothetical protein